MITMIAIGIEAPDPRAYAFTNPSLMNGFQATLNIVLAYSGHMSFFSFQSELANPADYPKALIAFQATDTSLYLVTAVVIYRYGGPNVLSPALLSASELVSKIAFGISIGTIVIAGVVICHVGAKCIYVRLFRGTHTMSERSFRSYGTWVLITFLMWVIAWLIAEAIPVFNDLLNMIAAAFCSWFSFGLEGLFWLKMNRGQYTANFRKMALTAFNIFLVAICCLIVSFTLMDRSILAITNSETVRNGSLGDWNEHSNQCAVCRSSFLLCLKRMNNCGGAGPTEPSQNNEGLFYNRHLYSHLPKGLVYRNEFDSNVSTRILDPLLHCIPQEWQRG